MALVVGALPRDGGAVVSIHSDVEIEANQIVLMRARLRRIRRGRAINYEGAFNSDDWNSVGDIFPPLVHWKVANQQFTELEYFQCDQAHPLCPVKP